jgi:outer membrane receptor protein involved in Fe transport
LNRRVLVLLVAALVCPSTSRAQTAPEPPDQTAPAQDPQKQPHPPPPLPTLDVNVTVVGTTPLPGVELPRDEVPAPVQTANSRDIDNSGALNLADFLNRRMNGVHVNEMQGNPFQPDISYRGYTASPLLGTPQGLSVYMDGVRLNQAFGEVVSWDLIPRIAIGTTTLVPGSNPIFGLNTLGGALALETKNGRTQSGTTVQVTYGNDQRRALEFEYGGTKAASGLDWYLAGNLFAEDGWRDNSPSDVAQLFGKIGWQRARHDLNLSVAFADNSLTGNGLQEQRFLDRDYASIYTQPDETDDRSTLFNATTRHTLGAGATLTANAYYRFIRTNTLNGDINEDSLDQSMYQPSAAEQAALAAAGYTGVPTSGANASNTPFPLWRCIGNVLLDDEPAEKCNGLINRTRAVQNNGGASGQITWLPASAASHHQLTVGGAFDRSQVDFTQSTQLGYLNPDRSVTGVDAFGDGVTGGNVDGEPFDTRVDLGGVIDTASAYATDTLTFRRAWHVTLSGRFNRTAIHNSDRINPGAGPGSLDGDHVYSRFNPAAGVTFSPARDVNLYASYGEGSRAPTAIELGCADPEQPCKLPNAMAGDPPLEQVVTRTWEAGVRGMRRGVRWHAGFFRADNRDDILFVLAEQTGFGYFTNFGRTRRQGFELGAERQAGRVTLGAGYTFLDATFQSGETLNGESNSSNDLALAGQRGLEGSIEIEPGNRMPLIPRHSLKAFADVRVTNALSLDADVVSASESYARGNENNRHEPDGTYYLGPGTSPAYGILSVGGRYDLTRWLQLVGQINNLFDYRYFTAAQLGPTGFSSTGTYVARPLPAVNGEFPVQQATFYAPGAPRRAWVGTRLRF